MKEVVCLVRDNVKNNQKDDAKKKSPMNPIQIFLFNFLTVIFLLWLLFGIVIGVVNAPNDDMFPGIKTRDLLVYYRLDHSYHAQDIVVLVKNDTVYIGRIVAVSGDSVDISDSERPVINGNMVSEPHIYNNTPRFQGFLEYPVQLYNNEYFVLCDARSGSEDSRYYGKVSSDEICGKVLLLVRRNNL